MIGPRSKTKTKYKICLAGFAVYFHLYDLALCLLQFAFSLFQLEDETRKTRQVTARQGRPKRGNDEQNKHKHKRTEKTRRRQQCRPLLWLFSLHPGIFSILLPSIHTNKQKTNSEIISPYNTRKNGIRQGNHKTGPDNHNKR